MKYFHPPQKFSGRRGLGQTAPSVSSSPVAPAPAAAAPSLFSTSGTTVTASGTTVSPSGSSTTASGTTTTSSGTTVTASGTTTSQAVAPASRSAVPYQPSSGNAAVLQNLANLQVQISSMQAANAMKASQLAVQNATLKQGTVPVNGPQDVLTNLKNVLPDYLVPGNLGEVNSVIWPFWFTNITPEVPAAVDGTQSQATATITITQEAAFIVTDIIKSVFRFGPSNQSVPTAIPSLGAAEGFALLAGTGVTNTAGPSFVSGDIGSAPGAVAPVGFLPGVQFAGAVHTDDAAAIAAQAAALAAFNSFNLLPNAELLDIDLGGLTLPPGVYSFDAGSTLTGSVTLDGQGNPNAVWAFLIPGALAVADGSNVVLKNGAQPGNVNWVVGAGVTLGTNSEFQGVVLAEDSIVIGNESSLTGSAISLTGAVTLTNSKITQVNATAGGAFVNEYVYVDSQCCGQDGLAPGLALTIKDAQSTRVFMSNPIDFDTVGDGVYPTELPTPYMFLPNSVIQTQLYNSSPTYSYVPFLTYLGVRCRIEDAQRIMSLITG